MKRIGVLLAAVLIVAAASGPAAGAPTQEDLDRVEREKSRMASLLEDAGEEVQEAGQTLAETETLLPGAEEDVSVAEGRVAAAEAVAAEAEREAEEAREALEAAQEEYEEAADAVEEARQARAEMFTATYRGAELLTVDAILSSDDTSQALDRMTYLEFMIEGKNIAVEDVTLKRREASNAEGTATVAEAEAAEAEAAAEQALADAEERYEEAVDARAEVERLVGEREEALAVAEDAESEAQSVYDRLERESEDLADALREADSGSSSSSGGSSSGGGSGSGFVLPVDGWKSSDFGWRTHPIYGTQRFHSGTDFAAGHGATIHAVDSGTVVYAGWNGGYGMLTCISHGGGVTSCYAHQSSISVSNGQHVSRDQSIGAVGTTGTSTGAHLHFEVRKGGNPVNPLPYLPSCLCR